MNLFKNYFIILSALGTLNYTICSPLHSGNLTTQGLSILVYLCFVYIFVKCCVHVYCVYLVVFIRRSPTHINKLFQVYVKQKFVTNRLAHNFQIFKIVTLPSYRYTVKVFIYEFVYFFGRLRGRRISVFSFMIDDDLKYL